MLRILGVWTVGNLLVLALISASLAQTNQPVTAAGAGPVYSLDQFGPVGSAEQAEATYQQASQEIIAAGGGVLVIPTKTAEKWTPKNNSQEELRNPPGPAQTKTWKSGIGVTVFDARGATPTILPPQVTGLEIDRTLNLPPGESLPFWGAFPMLTLRNTILHGSTSYRDWLQEDAPAGKDSKFYVATIRGIFPGMFMSIGEYGTVERLCVKSLGYDQEKKMWYFTADTAAGQPKHTIMGNKNNVNVLNMDTYSHNENQTLDILLQRHNYSQGDNYMFYARMFYMSDLHSTAGDENGNLYGAMINSEVNSFRAQVERWTPATQELVFKAGQRDTTLGSGRPVINLNPAKWITNGTVSIVRPASWTDDTSGVSNAVFRGQMYPTTIEPNRLGIRSLRMGGLIRFSADAPVGDEAIGRYFAVNEEGEYAIHSYGGGARDVRRWYLIDSLTKNADGTKDVRIIRHWWGAKSAGAPTLYKPDNYSWDGHDQPLHYVIAPGANAYDVSDAVHNPKRTIRLAPAPFTGSAVDFAAGDPVEQAIGPDPFKPIAFRSMAWDSVPGVFPSPLLDLSNFGVMRDAALTVHGGAGDYEAEKTNRYDRNPTWDKFISFDSACNTGVRFGGDTGDAALLFTQPHNRVQPIKWYYGPTNEPPRVASLTVARETGALNFTGPISVTGLSGDGKTASRNLRGKNVAVKVGGTSAAIAFPVEELDGDYAVFVEQSWLGNRAIVRKDAKGFTIQFEKPAPEGARLDWMIVR